MTQKITLFIISLFVSSITLSQSSSFFSDDGFTYELNQDGGVTITGRASGNLDTEIIIPDTASDGSNTFDVTSIGNNAFIFDLFSTNQLTSVIIPNSVTTIGAFAFSSNQLTDISIPDSVIIIGNAAFQSNGLISATIGNGVTTIEDNAFSFNQLTDVTIPNSVTTIGFSAFGNNQLASVIIPNGVTTIESGTFSSNQLTSVIIPNGVTTIEIGAFSSNQLTSVTIPNSVTTMGNFVFGFATPANIGSGEHNITFLGLTPPIIGSSLTSNASDITVTVPCDALQDYLDNELYTDFFEILEAPEDASFNYTITSFCNSDTTLQAPTITGIMGGTFSEDTGGLSIDTTTGEINPIASEEGSYTVTYTTAGACPGTATAMVTIITLTTFSDENFTYTIACDTDIVTVTGRVEGNTDTDIVIPNTITNEGVTYDVTIIGDNAFENDELTSVTISENIITIGENALGFATPNTTGIGEHNVTFLGETPPTISANSFVDNSGNPNQEDITITVPDNALDIYINDTAFEIFTNIVSDTPLSTQENSLENNLSLYPNPTKGQIQVSYVGSQALNNLVITDILGKRVQEISLNDFSGTQTIDVSYLQTGIYFFIVMSEQNTTTMKVIIK